MNGRPPRATRQPVEALDAVSVSAALFAFVTPDRSAPQGPPEGHPAASDSSIRSARLRREWV
jgi:hypothetical protein